MLDESTTPPVKTCNKCGRSLPATSEYFHKLSRAKDGFWPSCKPCRSDYERGLRARNPELRERIRLRSREYYYADVEATRKRQNELRQRQRDADPEAARRRDHDAYMRYRDKRLEKCAEYREEHREELRAYFRARYQEKKEEIAEKSRARYQRDKDKHRAYSRSRKARKKMAPGKHSAEDERAQYARQRGKCYYCGTKVEWGAHHVDHVVPLSRGGGNGPDNLVVSCPFCNLSKGAKLPHEFGGRLL